MTIGHVIKGRMRPGLDGDVFVGAGSSPSSWQCAVCGWWNIDHPDHCTACTMREESVSSVARCWAYDGDGLICGRPAVGIDYDGGRTMCKAHLEAYLARQEGATT